MNDSFRVRIKTEFLKKPGPYGLVANPDFKQIQTGFNKKF